MTTAGQVRNAYPAFRIFVFGQEVTEDVLSCKVNLADARAPNTAEFVLANKGQDNQGRAVEDRYIITELDIQALYGRVNLGTAELPDVKTVLADAVARELGIEQTLAQESVTPVGAAFASLAVAGAQKSLKKEIVDARDVYVAATETIASDVTRQIRKRIDREIQDVVKRQILHTKVAERSIVSQPDISAPVAQADGAAVAGTAFTNAGKTVEVTSTAQLAALRGEAARYPFQQGDCIFHSNDPVRIFWRDPFNPKVWYHMFAGFVSDWVDDVDENNVKTVTIRVEDVTRIFRYGRITTNPGIFDIEAVQQVEDAVLRTFFTEEGFSGLTLPEFMYTLIFGSAIVDTSKLLGAGPDDQVAATFSYKRLNAKGESTVDAVLPHGCGSFSFDASVTYLFGPDATAAATPGRQDKPTPSRILDKEVRLGETDGLAKYQRAVDHQVLASDLETMALVLDDTSQAVSRSGLVKDFRGDPTVESVITAIGENPQRYPVDGGRLVMLLPASLGVNTNRELLLKDLNQAIALKTTFRTRLATIYDVLERLEFSFWASPKGDLLCEMPLYDFDPEDFGPTYAPRFHVSKANTVRHQRTFTDEKMRTQFLSTWHPLQNYVGAGTADSFSASQVVTLRALIPQFGVRCETAPPTGFIASPEAAQFYAQLKLNQWNADVRSSSYDCIPSLCLLPNRPLLFTERNHIATTRSISHSLDWGSDMSMTVGTNYQRGWAGQYKTGTEKLLYEPLGGFASRPLNYAVLFKTTQPEASTATPTAQPSKTVRKHKPRVAPTGQSRTQPSLLTQFLLPPGPFQP